MSQMVRIRRDGVGIDGANTGLVLDPARYFAVHGDRLRKVKRPCIFCGIPVDSHEWPEHCASEHPGCFTGNKEIDRAERLRCEPLRDARGIKTPKCRDCGKPFETQRQVNDHARGGHK
jgi:hypothetical protein